MVPQLRQGFLQPWRRGATGNPQRLHVGGDARRPGGGKVELVPASPLPRISAILAKSERTGEERIGKALDPDCGVQAMPAMNHGGIG
jgi:hypothetical protein